jgi:hypothetical protein
LVELILLLLLLSEDLLGLHLLRRPWSLIASRVLSSLIVLPLLVLVLLLLVLLLCFGVLGHLHLDLFNLIGEGWLHGQRAHRPSLVTVVDSVESKGHVGLFGVANQLQIVVCESPKVFSDQEIGSISSN